MNASITKQQAALKKDEAKLKKFLTAIKKFISKEFLWILFVLLLALPITLIIYYLINHYYVEYLATIKKLLNGKSLPLALYALSIGGIYFTRAIIGAINTLTKKATN